MSAIFEGPLSRAYRVEKGFVAAEVLANAWPSPTLDRLTADERGELLCELLAVHPAPRSVHRSGPAQSAGRRAGNGEAEPGPVGGVKPSGDRVRLEVNVGASDRAPGPLVPAAGDQTAPLVSLQIEAGDLDGHSEYACGGGDGHFVLEQVEEP